MTAIAAEIAGHDSGVTGRELRARAPGQSWPRAHLLLVVVAVAVAATRHRRAGATTRSVLPSGHDEQAIPTVALVSPQARRRDAANWCCPATSKPSTSASIHGQVSGYVQEWRKDIGAKVRQGDMLAVIDTPELDQRISEAESELTKAKANSALAKVTAERWNSLRSSAAVSQQAADEKQSDANATSAAEVDAAQANVDRLKALKAFANIVAPFDGVVTARNIDVGSLVKADCSQRHGAVHRRRYPSDARSTSMSPQSYAADMKDGMKATLNLPEYPNRKFDATIETTSHGIDQKSRSLLVELIADNKDGALSPGAFARVHFQIPARQERRHGSGERADLSRQ